MYKQSKKRFETMIEIANDKIKTGEEVKPEDFFTEDEMLKLSWGDTVYQADTFLQEHLLKKSVSRECVYIFDKLWKKVKVGSSNGSCYVERMLYKKAKQEGLDDTTIFSQRSIREEVLAKAPSFEYSEGEQLKQTRYHKYVFPNGTLDYDQKTGDYEFMEGVFDLNDNIREEENPMFPYDYIEDLTGIDNLYNVFMQWGISPRLLVEIITYMLFSEEDFENKIIYLLGAGSNGKSMLIKLIQALFPSEAVTTLWIRVQTY